MKLVPLAVIAALAAAAPALPLSAASPPPSGFAYDSVMKFQPGSADPSTIQPGSFDSDYAAASQVPKQSGGGMFGLGKMIGSAQAAMAMFKTGTATRHYIGGSKERVDTPATQTAIITDCAARTITTLDLAKKTYTVVSMDQPYRGGSSSGGGGKPGPAPTDDGTKVAIAFTSTSLGPKTVEQMPTTGYDADMKMTVTKADGETSTGDMTLVAYYTAMAEPAVVCPHVPFPATTTGGSGAPSAAMLAQYGLAMQALKSKGDSRFTVSQSGPPLPAGKFSMFNVFALKSDKGQGSFNVIDERGNARPISPGDPVFSVPPDFTKVGS